SATRGGRADARVSGHPAGGFDSRPQPVPALLSCDRTGLLLPARSEHDTGRSTRGDTVGDRARLELDDRSHHRRPGLAGPAEVLPLLERRTSRRAGTHQYVGAIAVGAVRN